MKLLVEKNKEVYKAERYAISLGSLKGGQSVIINVPLKMTVKALAEQTFTLMLDAECYKRTKNVFWTR